MNDVEASTGRSEEHAHRHGPCCGRGADASNRAHDPHAHHEGSIRDLSQVAKDPVCGMSVDPETSPHRPSTPGTATSSAPRAAGRSSWRIRTATCGRLRLPRSEAVPEGAIYTYPMHPEVRQANPGRCPICGMALEPLLATSAGPIPSSRALSGSEPPSPCRYLRWRWAATWRPSALLRPCAAPYWVRIVSPPDANHPCFRE